MESIINTEFSAATLLISFGTLIGCATSLQKVAYRQPSLSSMQSKSSRLCLVCSKLKVLEGVSQSTTCFSTVFAHAALNALGPQEKASASNNTASKVLSDVFAFVGMTLPWVYWPFFVAGSH